MATPLRTIRVSDELWKAVQDKAKDQGETVTGVIIQQLESWLQK
jgi:hypothetical protein